MMWPICSQRNVDGSERRGGKFGQTYVVKAGNRNVFGTRKPCSRTGFDNIRLAEFASPPLTTVHIPREQIGHIMYESLVPDPKKTPHGAR